ncbi:glutaredoxin family protein [Roseateles sp. BYS180W]|uniref:Glutaredoxin family protein n=1 Tax=Roseateles rivi TaxID=3299028 RepID=A0ABW7FSG9_9BURK
MSSFLSRWRGLGSLALVLGVVLGLSQWARWSQQDRHAEALRQLLSPGQLQMISSTTCTYCDRARTWFTQERIPFTECYIERDKACLARYQALGARGTPTFVLHEQVVLGLDLPRLQALAQQQR